jgi:hypothetical protein
LLYLVTSYGQEQGAESERQISTMHGCELYRDMRAFDAAFWFTLWINPTCVRAGKRRKILRAKEHFQMGRIVSVLTLLLLSSFASGKSTVNGSANSLLASGVWEESHEGASLFCMHVTNAVEVTKGHSEATCFLTEVQALAKDSALVSTNLFVIQTWDEHGLTAITTFYANKNGDETTASAPNAVKYTFRLVVDFDAHSITKYIEAPARTLSYHLN